MKKKIKDLEIKDIDKCWIDLINNFDEKIALRIIKYYQTKKEKAFKKTKEKLPQNIQEKKVKIHRKYQSIFR